MIHSEGVSRLDVTLMVYPAVSKVSATVGAVFAGFLNMPSVDLVGAARKPV